MGGWFDPVGKRLISHTEQKSKAQIGTYKNPSHSKEDSSDEGRTSHSNSMQPGSTLSVTKVGIEYI